jgi:hypothetical protein
MSLSLTSVNVCGNGDLILITNKEKVTVSYWNLTVVHIFYKTDEFYFLNPVIVTKACLTLDIDKYAGRKW